MKITRANVEDYAKDRGWQPIQVDGIPDGFAWKQDGITIGGLKHPDREIYFKPLANWGEDYSIIYNDCL